MKILLNECIDWRFARELIGHDVKSARQTGWATIKNGELLTLAAGVFDAFITVDRNLAFQQNLTAAPIAVFVLRARSNRLSELKSLAPSLLRRLEFCRPGAVTYVDAPS